MKKVKRKILKFKNNMEDIIFKIIFYFFKRGTKRH